MSLVRFVVDVMRDAHDIPVRVGARNAMLSELPPDAQAVWLARWWQEQRVPIRLPPGSGVGLSFPIAGENALRAIWWSRTWAVAYQRKLGTDATRWRLHKHEKEAWSRVEDVGATLAKCFGHVRVWR